MSKDNKAQKIHIKGEEEEEQTKKQENVDEAQRASATNGNDGTDTRVDDADETRKGKEDPLAEANEKIAELKDKYLRVAAEFDNFKKRTLREKADLILNGGEKTITAILPVLDDFERALADKSEDPNAIREGEQVIYNKFIKALKGLGVERIDTKDKDFDTDFHEAVAMVPGMGDDKKGKVIDCVQTGYTLNNKVIRHAKVAVGQ